jgi:hypothetical protein
LALSAGHDDMPVRGGFAMSSVDYLYCAVCDGKRLFETPQCPDGHGADCPDRACAECGAALYLDVVVVGSRRAESATRPDSASARVA